MVCFSHASLAFFYASDLTIARQSYPISRFLCFLVWTMDSHGPKKVAEVSGIWLLVFMFPLKIVHRTKQREETVWTSRTCFLLKYWPQRLVHKSLLRSLYKVKCLWCSRWNCYIQESFRVKTCQVFGWHFIRMYTFFLFLSVFAFQPKQNVEVARVWKNLRASGEKQAKPYTFKTKHKISIANSYSYLVSVLSFAILP